MPEKKLQIISHEPKTVDEVNVEVVNSLMFGDPEIDEQYFAFAQEGFNQWKAAGKKWGNFRAAVFHSIGSATDEQVVYRLTESQSIFSAFGFLDLLTQREDALQRLEDDRFSKLRNFLQGEQTSSDRKGTRTLLNYPVGPLGQVILTITNDGRIPLMRRHPALKYSPGLYNFYGGFTSEMNTLDGKTIGFSDLFGQGRAEFCEESGLKSADASLDNLALIGVGRDTYDSYMPTMQFTFRTSTIDGDGLIKKMQGAEKFDGEHFEHDTVFLLPEDKILPFILGEYQRDARGVAYAPTGDTAAPIGLVGDTLATLIEHLKCSDGDKFARAIEAVEEQGLKVEVLDATKVGEYSLRL